MIGNDIIDLVIASKESNWRRKGYLAKLLTDCEFDLFQNSNHQEIDIWNLWSRKEAVYKILIQEGKLRGFYPKKIECLNMDYRNGIVKFENDLYYTKSYFSNDFVYSEAVKETSDFKKINNFTSEMELFKINGIPFAELKGKIVAVSKTHHGRFEKIVYLNY